NGNVVAGRADGTINEKTADCTAGYEFGSGQTYVNGWRNCTAKLQKMDVVFLQTQLLIALKEKAGIQLQVEIFDFMADAKDLEKIKEVNANCILMANLEQASTSGTQTDNAPVYDSDG
nr:hypothetical protein [Tanacetum cinerariifolium]